MLYTSADRTDQLSKHAKMSLTHTSYFFCCCISILCHMTITRLIALSHMTVTRLIALSHMTITRLTHFRKIHSTESHDCPRLIVLSHMTVTRLTALSHMTVTRLTALSHMTYAGAFSPHPPVGQATE